MDKNTRIELEEKYNYILRSILPSIIYLLLFLMMITLGGYRYHTGFQVNAIKTIIVFLAVLIFMDDPLGTKYFLHSVYIKGDDVIITYKNKMILNQVTGKRKDFKASKKRDGYSRLGTPFPQYLEIKFKGEAILKQSTFG